MSAARVDVQPASARVTRRYALGSRAFLFLVPGLVAAVAVPRSLAPVLGLNALAVLLFALDAWLVSRGTISVVRRLDTHLRARSRVPYQLEVASSAEGTLRLTVRDTGPDAWDVAPVEHAVRVTPGHDVTLQGELTIKERGRARFGDAFVRRESLLGLCALIERVPLASEVRVLPEALREAARTMRGPRREVGDVVARIRKGAQGNELESLREYVSSDPLRAIDWKATAKRNRPVTRLYQPERSQTVWFVLDASRTMAATLGEESELGMRTRFDVALEALLVVSDGALRAGDQVGVVVVGDKLARLIPPGRGRGHYRRLLDSLSELHAQPVRLDVRTMVAELEARARKRSLVVVFTDLENEVHGEALCERAHLLTRRHLVLCVTLDDSITRELADRGTSGGDEPVFQRAAAIDMLRERTELTRRLEKRGVAVLEADEHGLAGATLERYLTIKTRALL